jgi:hypothetical protein
MGYELCFFEPAIGASLRPTDSQRNHVTFACYPIQLSKNRHPWKGRQDCQTPPIRVKRNVSDSCRSGGTISSDPDTTSYSCGMLEKIGTASRTAGTRKCRFVLRLCQLPRWNLHNFPSPRLIPASMRAQKVVRPRLTRRAQPHSRCRIQPLPRPFQDRSHACDNPQAPWPSRILFLLGNAHNDRLSPAIPRPADRSWSLSQSLGYKYFMSLACPVTSVRVAARARCA